MTPTYTTGQRCLAAGAAGFGVGCVVEALGNDWLHVAISGIVLGVATALAMFVRVRLERREERREALRRHPVIMPSGERRWDEVDR